jgi:8-oxo-dGTP diphosphatase
MTPRIVTAAIIRRGATVLLARRASGSLQGKWEFPGGKLEAGESEEECLARELREELGLEVRVGAFLTESHFNYGTGSILLKAYEVEWVGGAMVPVDHDCVEWVEPLRLESFDLLPADVPIARRLAGRISDEGANV